ERVVVEPAVADRTRTLHRVAKVIVPDRAGLIVHKRVVHQAQRIDRRRTKVQTRARSPARSRQGRQVGQPVVFQEDRRRTGLRSQYLTVDVREDIAPQYDRGALTIGAKHVALDRVQLLVVLVARITGLVVARYGQAFKDDVTAAGTEYVARRVLGVVPRARSRQVHNRMLTARRPQVQRLLGLYVHVTVDHVNRTPVKLVHPARRDHTVVRLTVG